MFADDHHKEQRIKRLTEKITNAEEKLKKLRQSNGIRPEAITRTESKLTLLSEARQKLLNGKEEDLPDNR